MEYELGIRLDAIDEKLNWMIKAMADNEVTPKQEDKDETKESKKPLKEKAS